MHTEMLIFTRNQNLHRKRLRTLSPVITQRNIITIMTPNQLFSEMTAPKVVEPEVCPIVKAIIKLVSTLQYYKAFTDKEAEEILSLLK